MLCQENRGLGDLEEDEHAHELYLWLTVCDFHVSAPLQCFYIPVSEPERELHLSQEQLDTD